MKKKLENLKNNLKTLKKAAVAFSGGVDSSFLLAVCSDVLERENVLAVTASSETYTESELAFAKEFAKQTGVQHIIVNTDELNDPAFSCNPKDRCYYCKKSFYSKALDKIKNLDYGILLDGTNADDSSDYRPGYIAAKELGIKSPLLEFGFTKNDIRNLSKSMGLPAWDKPADPCLASRIPYGSKITREKLEAIANAEKFIHDLGFCIVRVRHHNETARIEIPASDLSRFMQDDIRKKVNEYLKSLGFIWISLDMEGYRTGSLNSAIK